MNRFVQYVIIIYQNWTVYTYVYFVLKETLSNILYKSPCFFDEVVYVLKYY